MKRLLRWIATRLYAFGDRYYDWLVADGCPFDYRWSALLPYVLSWRWSRAIDRRAKLGLWTTKIASLDGTEREVESRFIGAIGKAHSAAHHQKGV